MYFKNVKLYQVKKRKHLPQLSSKFTSLCDEDEQTKRNRKRLCRLYASKQSPHLIHQSESHRTHTHTKLTGGWPGVDLGQSTGSPRSNISSNMPVIFPPPNEEVRNACLKWFCLCLIKKPLWVIWSYSKNYFKICYRNCLRAKLWSSPQFWVNF